MLWDTISPFVWFLFFPTIFCSAWLGRMYGAIISSLISALLAWYVFIPPQFSWTVDNINNLWSVGVFIIMAALYGSIFSRLDKANRQLQDSNEKITALYEKTKELDILKTQFFANISHELRTPLTLILGPVANLLQNAAPGPGLEELKLIDRNARLLRRHVNELLDFAKLDAGKMAMHYSQADLAAHVRMLASNFSSLAAERRIGLSVAAPDTLVAKVDLNKFHRIILNILSNALKFTPSNGRVSVELRQDGFFACVTITDTGPGVPEAKQDIIFEPFRQLDGGTNRTYGGTGLGLAIAKEFTELHGGTISVRSIAAGGAQFSVTLPLSAPEGSSVTLDSPLEDPCQDAFGIRQAVSELRTPSPPARVQTLAASAKPRILVVEDNADMNRFICSILHPEFDTVSAYTGIDGIVAALENHFDLILSDIMMPGMSGDTMIDEMRKSDALKKIPIIVLTAKRDDELQIRLLSGGVQDFIHKPFLPDELRAKVKAVIADRRTTAEKLEGSEHRYRELFENMTAGFAVHEMIIDEDGTPRDCRFLEVNPAFETLTGLKAGDIIGKTLLEVMPNTENYWIETYGQVVSTGAPIHFENYAAQFGKHFNCWAYRPKPGHFAVIFYDITERKLLEEKSRDDAARFASLLRISEYQYGSVQDLLDFTLTEAITLTRSKIGYIYHYDETLQLFTLNTWSKEVMAECSIESHLKTSQLEKSGIWGEAVRQRRPIVVNDFQSDNGLKKGCPQGHAQLHSFMTLPVFSKDAIVAVIGVANKESAYDDTDVQQLTLMMDFVWNMTEQIRTDQQLQLSENKYRQLLESIHLLALIMNTAGEIVFCNSYFCTLTGYCHDEAIGMSVPDVLVLENEREAERATYRLVIEHKAESHFENHIITQNGEVRLIVWNRTPVFDLSGNVTGIASIGIDITKQRSTEEQLLQAQKMEAVGQLAGGVAHDFNNILTIISGYCSLLQMGGKLQEDQKEYIAEIASSAEKAAQLTHGLLAFSRKQPLLMKHENLNEIIQHVHKYLSRLIGEDVKFHSTCCGTDLHVRADKGQIEQVLINLATNARDAMPNGGDFSIRSDITELDASFNDVHGYTVPPGKYAVVTVSDTGAGISKEHLDRIFEPFFTTKEVGKGTGLGMAIIYGIIKQHNGFINVYSEVGHGTTFRIYLPIEGKQSEACIGNSEEAPIMGGSETILVTEDDPSVRELMSRLLSSGGYRVITAEDGLDAVEKFKRHHDQIKLIVMDMIMPKKNGKEAYADISAIKERVKVIFCSGYTADFMQNRGVSEEGIELIMKPVQPTELLRKIRKALDA